MSKAGFVLFKNKCVNNVEIKTNMDYVFKKFGGERIRVQRKSKGEGKILTVYLTV